MSNPNKRQISILATSDVHGYIFPTNYIDHSEKNLGLAKISTLVEENRRSGSVLLLDNGDLIQGSPLTFYHSKFQSETANPMVKVANELNYAASVFGNHEFNYGLDYLQRVIDESTFSWLSANILNEKGQPAFGKPYIVKEIEGVRIAILGVTTHYIPNWEDPKHIKGLSFADALESTKTWVKYIRNQERPDVMIVSYHGGFERDLETGEPTEEITGENQGYQIYTEVEGIDVLITGHQHRSITSELNGVTVVQPSNNGQLVAEIKLILEDANGEWQLKGTESQLWSTEHIKPDPNILSLVEEYEEKTQAWLDTPIGTITGDMTITDPFETRLHDSPLIEFINRVQMDIADVEISNTSLFNNTSPGFREDVTMRDIVSNYVYPNTLKVIRVTGQDIKDALEQSASYFVIDEKEEINVNPAYIEPKPQHYNYDMWEGIEYELTITNPVGERVTKLNFKGKPIDYNEEYDVVMNNYRAGGGGNFRMFQGKPVIKDIPTDMTELIANYILKRKHIEASCDKNWRVIK